MSCPIRDQGERLGQGTYGDVYLVNTEQKGLLALKTQSYTTNNETVGFDGKERVIKVDVENPYFNNPTEIDIMARLSHPHLMPLEGIILHKQCGDLVAEDTSIGLLMPLATGDLGGLYQRPVLTYEGKRKILFSLASAVGFLHQNHYLHLDIKLANVLYKGELSAPDVILSDFGLSEYVEDVNEGFVEHHASRVTAVYRPPENLAGIIIWSGKTDIWSLGVLFVEILTGRPLFGEPYELRDILKRARTFFGENKRTWLNTALRKKVPADELEYIIDLLSGMLDLNPKHRFNINQVLEQPYFAGMELPHGTLKEPGTFTYPIAPRQLEIIREYLMSIPTYFDLNVYFHAMDLMFRTAVFAETPEDMRWRCMAVLFIAFTMARVQPPITWKPPRLPPIEIPGLAGEHEVEMNPIKLQSSERMIALQLRIAAELNGQLMRNYLFAKASSLEQLERLHPYMKDIAQAYYYIDVDNLYRTLLAPKEVNIPSKEIFIAKTVYAKGPGF